jgi:hypothetical protein
MAHEREINSIIEQVKPWPAEDRVALAYLLLRDTRKQTREPTPRRTVDRALGVARGQLLSPDDETVRAWVDEHRQEEHE